MLADDPWDNVRSRNHLAMTYLAAGRPAKAIPLYKRTLADCERMLGANHPDTKVVRQDLFALTGKPPRQRMPFETEEEPRPTSGRRTRGGRAGSYQPWSRRAAG